MKEKIKKTGIFVIMIVLVAIFLTLQNDIDIKKYFDGIHQVQEQSDNYFSNGMPKFATINQTEKPNVVLVVLDTVRPDHMGLYGYERNTTPNIDEFAKDAVIFENAFTVIPYTTSAHASMFTSKYPFVYQPRLKGAQASGIVTLDESYLTLAEVLKGNDYQTAAFISVGGMMGPESGLDQGFEHYNYTDGVRKGKNTTENAIKWLEKNKDNSQPFFLWVHNYDAHDAYNPPEEFDIFRDFEKEYDEVESEGFTTLKDSIARYDGEIRWVDNTTGMLLESIKELGLEDNTLVIIVTDHGELFGEHNVPVYQGMGPQVVFEHTRTLYEQEIEVATIMKLPGRLPENKRVESMVENIDLMPTIFDLLNLEIPTRLHGKSMMPAITEDEDTREYIISHLYPIISSYYKTTIRDKDYKLIYDHKENDDKFFDLKSDPKEMNNLYSKKEYQDVIKRYEEILISEIKNHSKETDIMIEQISTDIKQESTPNQYKAPYDIGHYNIN